MGVITSKQSANISKYGSSGLCGCRLLFKNEEADDFITGVTVGLFNYNATEIANGHVAADGSTTVKALGAHQGWVLRTTGSGGRANRIQSETLVCLTT